ncbi:npp1 domain-containing protein [Penicillium atrosanguineum]|uniref:Npp1 domain-containing protein n=1 Tax=Penicillium atrosanguineum TaxID=1132637 RepID=A0A9W9PL16_9EURO|nr:npp1 domain-containing protein [Penicillium atrosanguineum]KAJ5119258.1 npp1 domain-containing protein [Penicillium atrosanguineum]KAJ5299021.1 npp1 domain-containing protein [Penicillium atrosanguineum]
MIIVAQVFACLLALSTLPLAIAQPTLSRRGTIGSDEIVGFDQTVPSGTVGDAYLAYQPYLYVVNGCVPFPAVDAEGNTNAGLATTGASDGDCSSSTGQIYVRGTSSGDYYALMYAWYMPKDEPSDGLGHRHDWEGVIVWLSDSTSTTADNVVAVCPSAHGGWDCSTNGYTLDGTAALIRYYSVWPVDHQCGLTSTVGGTQPLIAWESLPTVAQDALDTTDFGSAIVPFIDAHFDTNLADATF